MDSSKITMNSNNSNVHNNNNKSSYDIGKCKNDIDIFPPEMTLNLNIESEGKLSHSAAKHKMAIRPKKSKPSRKQNEVIKRFCC